MIILKNQMKYFHMRRLLMKIVKNNYNQLNQSNKVKIKSRIRKKIWVLFRFQINQENPKKELKMKNNNK